MAWIAYALPVVPGEEDRLESFAEELEPRYAEYEELNRSGTVRRHYEWLQRSPQGSLRITVFEAVDPAAVVREFTDSDYDHWWTTHVREVHGFDPVAAPEGSFPTMIHSYEAD